MKRILAVFVFALPLAGCDGLGAGPCVHTYEEPVITLSAVAATGEPVEMVILTDFTLDGRTVEATEVMAEAEGAEVVGEAIHCEVACGFGTAEGTYTFRVHAEGYRSESITAEAASLSHDKLDRSLVGRG